MVKYPPVIPCIRCNLDGPTDSEAVCGTVEVPFCMTCLGDLGNPKTVDDLVDAVINRIKALGVENVLVDSCLIARLLYVWLHSVEIPAALYGRALTKVRKALDTPTRKFSLAHFNRPFLVRL